MTDTDRLFGATPNVVHKVTVSPSLTDDPPTVGPKRLSPTRWSRRKSVRERRVSLAHVGAPAFLPPLLDGHVRGLRCRVDHSGSGAEGQWENDCPGRQ